MDEEHFRLITGFNDIFVAIAAILLLVAVGWIAGRGAPWLGGFAVAAASWGLAEYFTRRRHMALPSILLLVTFVLGIAAGLFGMLGQGPAGMDGRAGALTMAAVASVTAVAAWAHWRRFHVPITVAAGAGAVVGLVLAMVLAVVPGARSLLLPLLLLAGLGLFVFAMRWDMSDRTRRTGRSDVAFWLHLMAAPMIAHPVFAILGVLGGEADAWRAGLVLLLYAGFGLVALAVDRRALLVSSLVYVLYAMSGLFERVGALGLNFALTGLVIGSALLTLSAFWHPARGSVVRRLPPAWQARLPVLAERRPARAA